MSLDPAQLGQALAYALLTIAACVATLQQGFSRWAKRQEEARELDKSAQEEAREKERRAQEEAREKERHDLKKVVTRPLRSLGARLVRLEHAVEGLQRQQRRRPTTTRTRRRRSPG